MSFKLDLKKWKIISVIGIFLLSSLLHFIYTWWPNFFTAIFFPVNESIFEHNKIIIGSFLIWSILEKIYYKDRKNALWAGFVSSLVCALSVMAIFTPVFFFILKTNDNIILTFIIFLIAIAWAQYIDYKLLNRDYNKTLEKYAILGFLLVIAINAFLGFYPIHNGLFYDYGKNIYGIGK